MKLSGYKHVQKGILLPILLTMATALLVVALFQEAAPMAVIFIVSALACAILSFFFGYLSVCDKGSHLLIHFGPIPLFRKIIHYADIVAVKKDRSHILTGWGIHRTSKGWLWNIGGFDCVRIETGRDKNIFVGTDDTENLVALLQSKIMADRGAKHAETMEVEGSSQFTESTLYSWTQYFSLIGSMIAFSFGIWWFAEVGRHCGVVRFYEQIFGILILLFWFTGTVVGLIIAYIARRKQNRMLLLIGSVLAMLVNTGLVVVIAKIAYEFVERN